jgi:hypothetical protein
MPDELTPDEAPPEELLVDTPDDVPEVAPDDPPLAVAPPDDPEPPPLDELVDGTDFTDPEHAAKHAPSAIATATLRPPPLFARRPMCLTPADSGKYPVQGWAGSEGLSPSPSGGRAGESSAADHGVGFAGQAR